MGALSIGLPRSVLAMALLVLQCFALPLHGTITFTIGASKAENSAETAVVCAEQVMALYSGTARASQVTEARAQELRSCIRPLVPYTELRSSFLSSNLVPSKKLFDSRRSLQQRSPQDRLLEPNSKWVSGDVSPPVSHSIIKKLIQWPPSKVLELTKRIVEFGGAPEVLFSALDPTKYEVPDVEGANAQKCQLTKFEYGQRFTDSELNSYMSFLFHAIVTLAPSVGFNVTLSRFDLFHGHIFTSYDTNRLGILFHAREYPAYNNSTFPLNLGYCQKGSPMPYDSSMDLRNILWLAPLAACSAKGMCSDDWLASGTLLILDAREGGIVHRELVPDYLDDVRTISEDEFGNIVADVNYLNIANTPFTSRIFIC
jgi:hypothetical protein